MDSLSRSSFAKLAKEYNLIPIFKEIVADVDTPVSAFLKLDSGESSFLLESVEGGETLGRYSFIGIDPFLKITGKDGVVTVTGEVEETLVDVADPLTVIERHLGNYRQAPVDGLPPFSGGAVGYIGYDAIKYFEPVPRTSPDDLDVPEILFVFTDVLVIFDHVNHSLKILVNARVGETGVDAAYDAALEKIETLAKRLNQPITVDPISIDPDISVDDFQTNFTKEDYLGAVDRAKDHIFAGDILQVVPAQRCSLLHTP